MSLALCGEALCENFDGSFLCICPNDNEEFDPRTSQCRSMGNRAGLELNPVIGRRSFPWFNEPSLIIQTRATRWTWLTPHLLEYLLTCVFPFFFSLQAGVMVGWVSRKNLYQPNPPDKRWSNFSIGAKQMPWGLSYRKPISPPRQTGIRCSY